MKTKVIIMMSLFISLFLTGCEKELVEVPGEVPGQLPPEGKPSDLPDGYFEVTFSAGYGGGDTRTPVTGTDSRVRHLRYVIYKSTGEFVKRKGGAEYYGCRSFLADGGLERYASERTIYSCISGQCRENTVPDSRFGRRNQLCGCADELPDNACECPDRVTRCRVYRHFGILSGQCIFLGYLCSTLCIVAAYYQYAEFAKSVCGMHKPL